MATCNDCGAPLDEDGECIDECWDDYLYDDDEDEEDDEW